MHYVYAYGVAYMILQLQFTDAFLHRNYYSCTKKDRLSIPVNITSAGLIIILICSIISSVAARDHGIAVIGILRIVVFIVFWILWCNIAEQKEILYGMFYRNYWQELR